MKRKLAISGMLVAATVIGPVHSWAFQSKGKSNPITAIATTGGTPNAGLVTISLRSSSDPIGTPAANNQISWSNINLGVDAFKIADGVIQMSGWFVTDGNGGIQIYTDNKA